MPASCVPGGMGEVYVPGGMGQVIYDGGYPIYGPINGGVDSRPIPIDPGGGVKPYNGRTGKQMFCDNQCAGCSNFEDCVDNCIAINAQQPDDGGNYQVPECPPNQPGPGGSGPGGPGGP